MNAIPAPADYGEGERRKLEALALLQARRAAAVALRAANPDLPEPPDADAPGPRSLFDDLP